jgi:hypothetical protein
MGQMGAGYCAEAERFDTDAAFADKTRRDNINARKNEVLCSDCFFSRLTLVYYFSTSVSAVENM